MRWIFVAVYQFYGGKVKYQKSQVKNDVQAVNRWHYEKNTDDKKLRFDLTIIELSPFLQCVPYISHIRLPIDAFLHGFQWKWSLSGWSEYTYTEASQKKMSGEKVVWNDMESLNPKFRNNTNLVKMYGNFLSSSQDIGTKMLWKCLSPEISIFESFPAESYS